MGGIVASATLKGLALAMHICMTKNTDYQRLTETDGDSVADSDWDYLGRTGRLRIWHDYSCMVALVWHRIANEFPQREPHVHFGTHRSSSCSAAIAAAQTFRRPVQSRFLTTQQVLLSEKFPSPNLKGKIAKTKQKPQHDPCFGWINLARWMPASGAE